MTEPAFTPAIAAALDRYTVPALPQGFADRLVERAQLRADIAALPTTRRASASPWKRTGRVIASVAAIGLFTAAAVAGGIFGKPVYVPGITEAMQQANIIAPKPVPVAQHHAAKPKPLAAPAITPPVNGEAKAKAAITALRADPQFQQLRPKQKMRAVVRETRTLIKSGEITRAEGQAALRSSAKESYEQLTPQQQQALKRRLQQARERREIRRDRMEQRRQNAAAAENPAP